MKSQDEEKVKEDSTVKGSSQGSKRNLQYKRMPEDKRRDLIFRVMYLNENVRSVCYELGFNFSTGRNLVQRYKKTGKYKSQGKYTKSEVTKEIDGKDERCPLGLVFLSDDKIKIVGSRMYLSSEEEALIKLHKFFMKKGII